MEYIPELSNIELYFCLAGTYASVSPVYVLDYIDSIDPRTLMSAVKLTKLDKNRYERSDEEKAKIYETLSESSDAEDVRLNEHDWRVDKQPSKREFVDKPILEEILDDFNRILLKNNNFLTSTSFINDK